MANPIIIYGPAACGKTYNAERLAAFFGCSAIVDEAFRLGMENPSLSPSTLYLTSSIRVFWFLRNYSIKASQFELMSFSFAMKLMERYDG